MDYRIFRRLVVEKLREHMSDNKAEGVMQRAEHDSDEFVLIQSHDDIKPDALMMLGLLDELYRRFGGIFADIEDKVIEERVNEIVPVSGGTIIHSKGEVDEFFRAFVRLGLQKRMPLLELSRRARLPHGNLLCIIDHGLAPSLVVIAKINTMLRHRGWDLGLPDNPCATFHLPSN